MIESDKALLMKCADTLRQEGRLYHDNYKRDVDASSKTARDKAFRQYEKYSELNRLARELDIIAGGL